MASTTTAEIAEAIKSIPEKKAALREALESLHSHASSLAFFTLQWKDLENHFAAIERSIDDRFRALQAKEESRNPSTGLCLPPSVDNPTPAACAPKESSSDAVAEATPRPELRFLCAEMDGRGLRAFINANHKELNALRLELAPAIRSAPDPAKLVLDAVEGSHPHKPKAAGGGDRDGASQGNLRTCILLLERLQQIAPEVKPAVKEGAKKLATVWKTRIIEGGDYALEALAFLQLLTSYRLASEFKVDEILDIVVLVSKREKTVDLCKGLGLMENMPGKQQEGPLFDSTHVMDLIQKLSNKGKQLDAVKFIYAFDLVEKYPPVPLLKAYIKAIKKVAQEVRKKGNNSSQSQNEAIAREIGALKSVIKAIEEYKLDSDYPRENLEKRIAQLEQQKADKKRTATVAAASKSKDQQQQRRPQQQPNKRPRLSTNALTLSVAAQPNPLLLQTQPYHILTDHAPYMGRAGSYDLAAAGPLYSHGGPGLSGATLGLGGSSSRSYLYSPESLAGSGLYDRPVTYGGHPLSGLPSSYNPSLYR